MKKKLIIGVIAGLNLGALAACSNSTDAANTQEATPAAVVAPAPAAAAASTPAVEPAAAAPAPVVEPAPTRAEAPAIAARPAPVVKHVAHVAKPEPEFAKVVSVKDAMQTVAEPREVCHDEQVVKQAPVKDEHQVAGTVAGAVAGGVIGNQVGDGKGKKIAKVVGILGGAYAGNKIQEKMQQARTVTTTERRCETVTETREQHVGYDVTYTWAGRTETVRMQRKPGATLPVRNGEVVTG